MTPLERNFQCWATKGVCDVCGDHTSVLADIATMRYRCFNCCVKENLAYEEREKQKKRVPLNLKEFSEL